MNFKDKLVAWWSPYVGIRNESRKFSAMVSPYEIEYFGSIPTIGPGYLYHFALYSLTGAQTLALLDERSSKRVGGEIPQFNLSCTYRARGQRDKIVCLFSLLLCTEGITGDLWKVRSARRVAQTLVRDLQGIGAAAKGHLFRCEGTDVCDRWGLPDDEIDAFWAREAQIGFEAALRIYRDFC